MSDDRWNDDRWPWTVTNDDGWLCIHGSGGWYISDACVEGDVDEFRELAEALRSGTDVHFKRCAARKVGDQYDLWSPRNTQGRHAHLPLTRAAELADIIEAAMREEPES